MEAQWSAAGACSNVTWPTLDAVVVAGLNRTVNASSVALQACGPAAAFNKRHAVLEAVSLGCV